MASHLSPDDLEDLITSAQDAFFDGDLNTVIELCKKVISSAPQESDAYELLTLSLFQSKPPRYQEAMEFAIDWGKKISNNKRRQSSDSNHKTKQLMMLIKCAYHSGHPQIIMDAAKQLNEITDIGEQKIQNKYVYDRRVA